MAVPSHCKRHRIVSRALNTSLVFGGVMRIELAAFSFAMSLLPNGIFSPTSKTDSCDVHVQICARTL